MKKIILLFLIVSLFCFGFALAQEETLIPNPIPHENFEELVNAVLDWILNIALVLMPLLLVWGGMTFITAAGDPSKVEQAKKIIFYTIIGFFVVLLSKSLIEVLQKLVESPSG
jgi:low temperature requirement protein LtrA